MSIFKNIFGSSDDPSNSKIEWKPLVNLGQLNEIVKESNECLVLIFKHSTRCGISRMVLKQFESEFNNTPKIISYFLDLLEHREVSNEIASRFEIQHQSPQLLIIKEGKVVFEASHENIDATAILEFL